MSERQDVLDRIAAMWQHRDPLPEGLIDTVLVALATESLDDEYELLHLVERSQRLDGVRSSSLSQAITVSFSAGRFSLLLRISEDGGSAGTRRVDGWVSPAQPMTVRITQQDQAQEIAVDERGRFEVGQMTPGLSRFWLLVNDGGPEQSFATPTFEL